MTPHILTSFKIQKYYQNQPRFNGVNLPRIKDKNLDEYSDIGTHRIALYVLTNDVI